MSILGLNTPFTITANPVVFVDMHQRMEGINFCASTSCLLCALNRLIRFVNILMAARFIPAGRRGAARQKDTIVMRVQTAGFRNRAGYWPAELIDSGAAMKSSISLAVTGPMF